MRVSRRLGQISGTVHAFLRIPKRWAPQRAGIAMLHGSNQQALAPLFGDERYEVVHLDGEVLYIHPWILLSTLRHAIELRKLKAAYAIAVLERIRPAIVVTFIDDSAVFQLVARRFRAARFLAIQNGGRLLNRDHPIGRSPQIYHREFACLGRYEVDQFNRHGARVETYYPVGSLKDSYYRAARNGAATAKAFDLCLVAQFKPTARLTFSDSFELVTQHVRRFCETHGTSLCVPLRKHPDVDPDSYMVEREYFERYLGKLAHLSPNVPGTYNTYGLVDRSRVSIGMHTTVLREGFGRGNRVLSCNFTGNPEYTFPVPGPWALADPAYELFERALQWLLSASEEEYAKACGDKPSYLIAYDDKMPTHVFLQRLIADAVRGAPEPNSDREIHRV